MKLLARRVGNASRGTPASGLGLGGNSRAAPGAVLLLRADFDAGFVRAEDKVAVIAASDLLGSRAGHRMPMELTRGALEAGSESALRIGDAVIHIEHGIGRLRGIESVARPASRNRRRCASSMPAAPC